MRAIGARKAQQRAARRSAQQIVADFVRHHPAVMGALDAVFPSDDEAAN